MLKVVVALMISLSASYTFASECKINKHMQANEISAMLEIHNKTNPIAVVDFFCDKCGDKKPRPVVIDQFNVSIIKNKINIQINKEKVQAENLFINGENVAHSIGCGDQGTRAYFGLDY